MKKLNDKLLSFSYYLQGSRRYNSTKNFVYDLLENDEYPYKKYFDFFMIFIILSSVTLLVMDVKQHIPLWLDKVDLYFITTIFIVEYLLRMWIYSDIHKIIINEYEECKYFDKEVNWFVLLLKIVKNKWKYVTSLSAIIDLIAILPSYRGLRVLRVLVLFRAFKMLRYTKSLTGFLYVLKNKKFELMTLLTLSTFFIFISGIMLYVFEGDGDNENIHNLFDAFYWALITISTVGYGDISPVTPEGRIVTMLIIITGIGLISFVTSIIVSSFNERLSVLREDRVVQEVGKKKKLTVICGYGLLGRLVAQGLHKKGVEFVVIERSEEMTAFAVNDGYHAVCANATKGGVFEKLGIKERISHVLCLTSDDIQNAFIAVNVKSLNESVHVASRCSDNEIAKKMEYAHVDQIIMPEEVAGMMGAVYAGEPVAFEALLSIIEEKEKTQIDEIAITQGSFLDDKKIAEVDFEKLRLILLGVFKYSKSSKLGEFVFNPSDEFRLNAGDTLICIGYSNAVSNLKRKM